jgi:SAM-dependent methyltransferase
VIPSRGNTRIISGVFGSSTMTTSSASDIWNQGDPYERYVGRWSRLVAEPFVRGLGMPSALRWLDVGCGTGALASTLLAVAGPKEVIAVEPSEGFLALARARLGDKATLLPGHASALPLPDASVDVVVSGLVLNFVPDLPAALAEMKRVVAPGGTIAAYVWDYAQGMELMRHFWDAAVSLDAQARALDEGVRFPLCQPAALTAAFEGGDLTDVSVAPLTISTPFQSFDDYWSPFLGGQGPAPAYACSLDEPSRSALRNRLRKSLPTGPDGSIELIARAWVVRGVRSA